MQHRIIAQAHRPHDCIDCVEAPAGRAHRELAKELCQYLVLLDKRAWEQKNIEDQLLNQRMILGMVRQLGAEVAATLCEPVYATEGNDHQALIDALEAVPEALRPTRDTFEVHYLNRAGDCRTVALPDEEVAR